MSDLRKRNKEVLWWTVTDEIVAAEQPMGPKSIKAKSDVGIGLIRLGEVGNTNRMIASRHLGDYTSLSHVLIAECVGNCGFHPAIAGSGNRPMRYVAISWASKNSAYQL